MLTKTFDSQTARFLASVATCIPPISGDTMQGWINNPKALKRALKALSPATGQSVYPVFTESKLLKPVAKVIVPPRTKPWNAAEFYQNGTGLTIFIIFPYRLDLSARQIVDSAPERPYVALLPKAKVHDKDIRKELPKTHLSKLEDIAGLIVAQPGGKSGFLLNNGYANIFYVEGIEGEVFVVIVNWISRCRKWGVDAWKLGDGHWDAGSQVLCPGNAAF